MHRLRFPALLILAVTVAAPVTWADSLTIIPDYVAQRWMQPLIFHQPGMLDSGPEVQATTLQSGFVVDFSGTQPLTTTADGVGVMTSTTFSFTSLTIKPNRPGATFTDYGFNVNTVDGASGKLTITVNLLNGNPITETFAIGKGQNYFTILAADGQEITGISLSSTTALRGVGMDRIGGVLTPSAPEPASLFLFGSGLAGLGACLRRRRRSKS